ncbi:SRPBCC family protein [Streptomyces sp. NPDC006393]|uniref:SRPBCC family protein n=1 Tax=Streptomyces sp. NPDC006393 TaxID=3156763 RepID=UPI0034039B7C
MVDFFLERTAPLPLDEAWRRLTEWPRHADAVPLTRVSVLTPEPTGVGTRLRARSGIGPLAFDDVMEVTVWRPPADGEGGLCRLEKRGRVVLGWAEIEVLPGPGGRSRVVWRENLRVRFLPRALDGALESVARRMFGRAVNRLLRTPRSAPRR